MMGSFEMRHLQAGLQNLQCDEAIHADTDS